MKNIILTVVLCLSAAGPSFAQNNIEAMRFLTVNALMQYGQKLYDRGNYNEASAVFNHVLTYDSHQAQALQYLKEMGHSFVQNQVAVRKSDDLIATAVDVSDTESLKEAIEAKKQSIEKLRSQIKQIRADIASQSEGSAENLN